MTNRALFKRLAINWARSTMWRRQLHGEMMGAVAKQWGLALVFGGLLIFAPHRAIAQEPIDETADRIERLQTFLNGVKLTGHFTVTGRQLTELTAEEYYILKAEKSSHGDYWMITARIKYGGKDFTLPMPLEIKWAGGTPVITVDRLTLPGMGTFDARVIIRPDAYAGTWQHDDVGGHLFGTVEKLSEEELAELRKSVRQRDD